MPNYNDDDSNSSQNNEEDSSGAESEEEDIPTALSDLKLASVPDSLKGIRACLRCGLLKTGEQFLSDGCDNCPFLDLHQNADMIHKCTTVFFDGTVAVMDPRESWTAKWLRIDSYMPGVYAISITGQFPKDMEEDLEAAGRRWRCKPSK